ncbi:MAG TPA: ribokinase [Lysobacter sp.]|nr:ribokinase [Lysobacter sp.]
MGRVVVVGSFNVDHVWSTAALPRAGETLGGRYRSGPGGKGFNQAIAAQRAGADTAFVCALGDDDGGRLARALAADDGLALHAATVAEPTGTAGIFVDADGRNSIVIGPGANAILDAQAVAAHADVFHGARVAVAQLETSAEAAMAAFRIARGAGASTLLNPAPADAVVPDTLWALTDLATPNETEFAAQLTRRGERIDPAAVATLTDGALHALCRRLLPHGTVVVTLGAAGAFVSHADARAWGDDAACYRVAPAAVRAIDTTGAGDAFSGALAASLASRVSPFAAHVRFAARYAGLSTEREGAALAMPRRDEVDARFGNG